MCRWDAFSININVPNEYVFAFQSKNCHPRRGEYNVYSTFQSHEPEFDYLKSLEIEEKINKIRWLKRKNPAHFLLSTNGKKNMPMFYAFYYHCIILAGNQCLETDVMIMSVLVRIFITFPPDYIHVSHMKWQLLVYFMIYPDLYQ